MAVDQAHSEIARIGTALEQAQAAEQDARDRVGSLETELTRVNTDSASRIESLEQSLSKSQAESEHCATDLTAKGQQIDRITLDLVAAREELQGLAGDADQDGVGDARDQCPDTPTNLATNASGCVSIELRGVEFASGSDQLRPTSKAIPSNMAVLSYMVEQGVPVDSLSAKGYGDTKPIANNETPEVAATTAA